MLFRHMESCDTVSVTTDLQRDFLLMENNVDLYSEFLKYRLL